MWTEKWHVTVFIGFQRMWQPVWGRISSGVRNVSTRVRLTSAFYWMISVDELNGGISRGFAHWLYTERGTDATLPPCAARFQLSNLRLDASAQHSALAQPSTKTDIDPPVSALRVSFLRGTDCGEEASRFVSYRRPIRMSTTLYINSYTWTWRHSFLIHLDFLEFKDFLLSVWVFFSVWTIPLSSFIGKLISTYLVDNRELVRSK